MVGASGTSDRDGRDLLVQLSHVRKSDRGESGRTGARQHARAVDSSRKDSVQADDSVPVRHAVHPRRQEDQTAPEAQRR